MIIVCAIFGIIIEVIIVLQGNQKAHHKIERRLTSISHTINYAIAITGNSAELSRMVASIGSEHDIDYVFVTVGESKKIIASTQSFWLGKSIFDLTESFNKDNLIEPI